MLMQFAEHTTPPPVHIHCTRFMQNEKYFLSKTDDPNWIAVSGTLYDKDGGKERVIKKHLPLWMVKAAFPNTNFLNL